ncbi:S8 family peptidase [Adhaeribacter rhizoryzae]|uniref:S8 family serine peptidase n=1 Tax=Adhaeribacter rhizoryzae TaxID=2607907 RepID=A0A5M6DMD5_9BACT|nr:S8 family serine peptidase [Adhaeribacter rhizoryzae]KAA5546545.1 S8 family serine peptidase [Adhaeribacter rhizoryzae]
MNLRRTFYTKTLTCIALASAFTMYGCQKDDFQASPELKATAVANALQANNKVEGQYIVVFKNNGKKAQGIVKSLIARGIISPVEKSDILEGVVNGFVAKLSANQVAQLQKYADVAAIEQDQYLTSDGVASTTTTTNTYTVLPGETVPQGVAMVGYGDGTGKTAWIIDSGVDINNSDLNVDVARSKSFLTGVTSVQDGYGHGTMIAGIIGAKNNGTGIIGVAPNATIVALRVVDNAGVGTAANAIKAVNHVSTYGKAGDVVNISGSSGVSATYDTAVKTVAAKGIFFAIAAGNSSVDCINNSPQRVNVTNVYTVSAMDYNNYFWTGSNFGSSVDLSAPGVNITSLKIGGGTTYGTGTSFSAPHVAGLLLLQGNAIGTNGTVIGDPDSTPDPIAHF